MCLCACGCLPIGNAHCCGDADRIFHIKAGSDHDHAPPTGWLASGMGGNTSDGSPPPRSPYVATIFELMWLWLWVGCVSIKQMRSDPVSKTLLITLPFRLPPTTDARKRLRSFFEWSTWRPPRVGARARVVTTHSLFVVVAPLPR